MKEVPDTHPQGGQEALPIAPSRRAVADEGDAIAENAPPKPKGRGKAKATDAAQKKLF